MSNKYDAIVVGARCAGSPTAMLLARKGYRVLLVDKSTFPSDTLSTHVIHPPGVAALSRWGLLDKLVATGCPPVHTYAFDFGPIALSGSPGSDDSPVAYCPRRFVLDKLLVDAAADAGAEVREGFTVDRLLYDDRRVVGIEGHDKSTDTMVAQAQVVVAADGRHSRLAEAVGAERYHETPPLQAGYYAYWRNLPLDGRFEIYMRPHRGFAAVETHDGLSLVVAGWPYAEFEVNRRDPERHYLDTIARVPAFAAKLEHATRESKLFGAALPGFFRKPFGAGWALVGDAGYNKDPITAQGITDAFLDAERCTGALDAWLSGRRGFDEAMGDYQRSRDEHALPMYELTCKLATLEPPPPEMQQLLGAAQGNPRAMDAFAQMNAGTISPAQFFAPEHVGAIMAAAS